MKHRTILLAIVLFVPITIYSQSPSPTPFVNFDFRTIDWRAISVFFAAVGILLVFYFQWWRNRKRLSYEVVSNVQLVSSVKVRDKVEIRYEGKPVESVHLVVIKLTNDGYQPIKKEEFEKPVKFIFRGGNVLSAEREAFHPENIGTEISYKDAWVEISPTLFNRKDYVQFKVLLDGFSKMEVDARIVGVSRVEELRPSVPFKSTFAVLVFASGFQLTIIGLLIKLSGLTTLSILVVGLASAILAWYVIGGGKSSHR